MRAKFINEIKQGVVGSGLAPIGVGKSNMLKSYLKIRKMFPDEVNEENIKLKEVIHEAEKMSISKKVKDRFAKYTALLEAYMHDSIDNYLCININQDNSMDFGISDIIYDMFDFEDDFDVIDDEIDNGYRVTYGSRITYSRSNKIGRIYIHNIETSNNENWNYLFVKYK